MDASKIKDRIIHLEGLLDADELQDDTLQTVLSRLIDGSDEDKDLEMHEKLIITQLLLTHFYNSGPPNATQFKQLVEFRLSRTDDSILTQHLTLIVVELFNVEQFQYSIDDGSSISLLSDPQSIIQLHNAFVERANDASLLLTWSYTISKITHALQSYSSDIPQSHRDLSALLLPSDQPQPLYQIIYSQLLHPQFSLFEKLDAFCISNTFQRASHYNSLAYKSVMKGLLDATLSVIHPSFINDFEGLVRTFTTLLSSSTTTVSAPLAHQFWTQYDSRFPASLILDVSRGRWPLDFFSLVKLLLSLSGVSSTTSDCQDEQLLLASEASERVFLYLSSLPSYTILFDSPSLPDESDPLIRIASESITLPGLDKSLAQHSIGRQLSPLNQQPPAVICWDFSDGVSGWNVLGRLLSDWLSSRSTRRRAPSVSKTQPLFDQNNDRYDEAVLSSLKLMSSVLGGNSDLAPLLIEQIGGSVADEEEELDLVAVLFAIIDKCLSTMTMQRSSSDLSQIVASSIDILTSLLQSFPGRVWTFLRGGTTIFTPESPILDIERNIGTYNMSKALLRLTHALFTESQQTVVSADPSFTKLKNEVLVKIVSWSINDVYIEHSAWRYVHLGDKLEIGLILAKMYGDIVEDGGTLPALTRLIKDSLLSGATAASLSPLVNVVASGGDVITKLYAARRVHDAMLAESVLEVNLVLAQLLLVSDRETESSDASLLKRVFFDRSVALAAAASVRKESKQELVDLLAVYIANRDSTAKIRLESTRLLTVLCAFTMPSSSLAGFFADPHSTVMGLVEIVADPYSDDQLRAAVWDLCAVVVATQPGLATLLLTGQSVGAAARELIKERNTDSVAGKKEEKELKRTALDIASENVEIWSQLWESSASLLSSVLRFLDIVWQNLDGHLPAVKSLRSDEKFWERLGDVALKDSGAVPPTTNNDTDSLIEDGSDRDGPVDAQALSANVVAYAHRLCSSSFALSIISNDRSTGSGGEKESTSASLKCTERIAGKAQQMVSLAIRNSVDTELHSNVHSSVKLAFDGLDLAQYHNIINPQFGTAYVFNTSLLKVKLDGFVASSASAAEAVDADLVYATIEHVKQLNLDWSIVDAQVGFTRSVTAFVSKACSSLTTPVDAVACATRAAAEVASESREGAVMLGVHADRLALILKLLELGLKKSNSDSKSFSPVELIENVEQVVNLPIMPVTESCRKSLAPPFHMHAMQIIFLAMHFLKQTQIPQQHSRESTRACRDILSTIITCLAISLEAAKGGATASDEEFDLLVVTFMAVVKSPLAPSVAYWLPLLVEADVIRLSLDVLSKIALNPASQPPPEDAMVEDDAEVQNTPKPLFLQAVIDLHLILCSVPQAAERMALDGLVAAYSASTLANLAEQGAVLSYDPAYVGTRNPWHTAWCRMLSVLTSLINVLGGSSQFIDIEIIGFIQLGGSQLANALSWNTETPFNLATIEEVKLTISLFVSIANSEHYAQNTSYGQRSQPSKAVLHAFNIRAMYLLQQLTYGLTHPHLILQLVEPITSNERERLNAGGEDGGEFFESLVLSLVALTSDLLLGVTSSLDCLAVLAKQRPEWPAESYALVQPNANININEMASIGTLLDLASYCIDCLKSGDDKKKKLAKSALEATLVLTATQMAMWAKSSDGETDNSTGKRSSLGVSNTLKRDISGALSEDFNAIVDRSKGVLSASERKLPAISKKSGNKAKQPTKGGKSQIAKADWKDSFKKKQAGVSDMTLLTTISNDSINDNLKKRFQVGEIYTYIGHVLISINPFKDLGIYTDDILRSYKGKNRLEMTPHVYAIAESMYYNMSAYQENQCVIISGESGAGKTEAAKRIMQYIAEVSGGHDSSIQGIKDMVLATNPLLESFGCAKTLRNNNSSRHGKYLEIMFNHAGEPVGARITNYLLEKGRVVGQINDERDFHIFYQLTKGASQAQREAFGLQGPDAYLYTSRAGCLDVGGIDDVHDFSETINAMNTIGLSGEEQNEIFRMLATILWLGNIVFVENDDGNAQPDDPDTLDFIAYLLQVSRASLEKAVTCRVMETQRGGRRGSVYEVPLNPAQATSVRDAFSKAIYNNLFEWIVDRINRSLAPTQASDYVIGILDIYGFEIFDDNSFEQLCINYVNEKLQQIFIELTLKKEQEEYAMEQIQWQPIKFFNNKIVCDLIEEKRPPGIFAALNDACATAHADPAAADNSFAQRLNMVSSNPHFNLRGSKFVIKHYAGDVTYNIQQMTDKNKDALLKDLLNLIDESSNPFLQGLFPERPDPNSKKRPPTAGDRIKVSANLLVEKLMASQPSYIRTIKPNQNRSATEYDDAAVLHQVKYLGLQENIRVRRAGFAYRNTFEKMIERFYLLSPSTSYAGDYIWQGDARSGCAQMLTDTGIAKDEWQLGITKAFIKNPETLFALETMRDKYWHNMAGRIQRSWRAYLRRRQESAQKIQRFWMSKKEGIAYEKIRTYGHQLLANRKERRSYSLVSQRRFMGDYLDVNGGSPTGEMLSRVCGFNKAAEPVSFSSRAEIMVSRLGRTSRPSPRFIVLTSKAFYIVVTTKEGTNVERKILVGAIKGASLSNLQDDFIVLNLGPTEEGDPILIVKFKTELVTQINRVAGGTVTVSAGPTIDYTKKKDKKAQIKAVKGDTSAVKPQEKIGGAGYKSHTITIGAGEPASSVSRPPVPRKPRPAKLATKRGAPRSSAAPRSVPLPSGGRPALSTPVPTPAARTTPPVPAVHASKQAATPRTMPPAPAQAPAPAAPPRPPATPARPASPEKELWKSVHPFDTQESGELSLGKDEIVEVMNQDPSGWWLVKNESGVEGWCPSTYLNKLPPKPKPAAAAPPPAPPVARAVPPAPAPAPVPAPSNGAKKAPPPVKAKPAVAPKPKPKPAINGGAAPPAPAPAAQGAPQIGIPANGGGFGNDLAAALAKRRQPAPDNDDW
ncbi:hypothetical protein E3P99_03844 [Wallemia hederae]|uniref:Uncharacterized protein n=1 Tax=Wallemia hederae TaxID=1540922 RepID=A0A4T0FFJ2_9BASI|nr:hypothetical protein E3P99_03844 [Wallemia hederae]